MSKRSNIRANKTAAPSGAVQSAQLANAEPTKSLKEKAARTTKQSQVVAMLRSPAGASIAAMMKATDWQQHSVRGFLAGVVQRKLKLKLSSEKNDGNRIYRIVGSNSARSKTARPSRRRA